MRYCCHFLRPPIVSIYRLYFTGSIKVLKRIAFGYRNFTNFRQRILLSFNTPSTRRIHRPEGGGFVPCFISFCKLNPNY